MIQRFQKYLPTERSKLRYWLVLSGSFLADPTPASFASGTAVLLIGMALHLWSKGTLRQNKMLAQTGPYCWVRHPFYLANAIIDLGLCVIINRIEVVILYFVFWIIAYSSVIKREERKLDTLFGEEFKAYKDRVPCFAPWRIPISGGVRRGFSRQNPNIASGSEIPRLLRLAGYPLLFAGASEFREIGISFFAELSMGFIALWSFLFLSCVSFTLKLNLKKQPLAMPLWIRTDLARNAFVILLLSFAFLFPSLEIEMDHAEFLIGTLFSLALLLVVSVARRTMKSEVGLPTLIEGAILIVICFLAELPWLSLLPLSYYSALWVDGATAEKAAPPSAIAPAFNMSWLRLQTILTVGVGLMLWKESFDDFRGFLLMLS